MKKLTVFTPAYNRGYTIYKCYESLVRQTNKNFKWLIIDDGSTDNTKEIIDRFIRENKIEIEYIHQENLGMHGAHNTAYENINTELNVCIDSDDYMPDDAVENILLTWDTIDNKEEVAGIIGLDAKENGSIVGSIFSKELRETTLFDYYYTHKGSGDKKLVYRTELTKNFKYPIFKGEKYVGLAYKYYKIDEKYKLRTLNKVLCIVEYMEDGSSKNMFKQYLKNPKGFAFYRIEVMKNPKANLKIRFKSAIHYISSSIMSKNKKFFVESPKKFETILAIPFGICLYLYIKKSAKRQMRIE